VQLISLGGVQKIDGWEEVVKEMHPLVRSGKARLDQISPEPFTGYAFHNLSRVFGMLYNTKLISKEELPKTHAELGDPKYKGKFAQPPFSSNWDIGILVFPDMPKEKWLAIVRKAGKNAGGIGFPAANLQRTVLGEYAFTLTAASDYSKAKARDPKVSLGIAFFNDYNPVSSAYYIVRKGARHPAAGTLFAMWMGTPEAKAIWQADLFRTQFEYGQSDQDKKIRQFLRENNARATGFMGSEKGIALLKWYGTKEGRAYRKALSKAIRGGRGRRGKR